MGARHILSRAMTNSAASTHLSFNGGKSQPGAGEPRSSPTIAHLRKCRLAESTRNIGMPSDLLVRAAYVGSHGSHLKETIAFNVSPVGGGTPRLSVIPVHGCGYKFVGELTNRRIGPAIRC